MAKVNPLSTKQDCSGQFCIFFFNLSEKIRLDIFHLSCQGDNSVKMSSLFSRKKFNKTIPTADMTGAFNKDSGLMIQQYCEGTGL